mmetsp:Transcript_8257/g.21999  ORF Transcript_8257/g.21999 Transcript_8257/m.21999 type:complete len:584 (+) Transcript_8257:1-1752(+)
MDPYKVLGIPAAKIKHPSDLGLARKRAKQLYKRLLKEGKKFDGKKVLEAFAMIQANLKNKPGEGAYKILGRSRKERELDKHFNHQTKEIEKNSDLKKALKHKMQGERGLRLPGDKERVARPRRRRHRHHRRRRVKPKIAVDVLQGLQRVGGALSSRAKFSKAIKLLYRWMKEYLNEENREYAFLVLQDATGYDFVAEDLDSRQDVVMVYDYVMTYFKDWFAEADSNRMLGYHWRVATILACRCFTDDAFMLSNTIKSLNEALEFIEEHKDLLSENLPPPKGQADKLPSTERGARRKDEGLKDDEELKAEDGWKVKAEDEKQFKHENGIHHKLEGGQDAKSEKGTDPKTEDDFDAKSEEEEDAKPKVESDGKSRTPRGALAQPVGVDVPLGSPDDEEDDCVALSSGDEGCVAEINSDDDGDDDMVSVDSEEGMVDDISLSSGSQGASSDVEEVEQTVFAVPGVSVSLDRVRQAFVYRCLATLFMQRGPTWAKSKIDNFFQDVFYRRGVLTPEQQGQVEAWQSRIKTLQKLGEREVGEANNILESHRPVVDSREMRTVIDSDSNAWASKQTFDSRDRFGGSKTLR